MTISILLAAIVPLMSDSVVHRGDGSTRVPGSKALPENSMPALERCWKLGYIPELDLQRTSDGVYFAFHDPTYRGRNIGEYTWAEVSRIDVGKIGGCSLTGVYPPKWTDVLDMLARDSSRRILIDKMSGDRMEWMAGEVVRRGLQPQVYCCTGSSRACRKWKRLVPGGKALCWVWTGTWKDVDVTNAAVAAAIEKNLAERLDAFEREKFEGPDIVQIHVRVAKRGDGYVFAPTEPLLRKACQAIRAHGVNAQLMPWTGGDDIEVYRRLAAMGADSFGTDHSFVYEQLEKDGVASRAGPLTVESPDGTLSVGFESDASGMRWTLRRNGKTLVEPSRLGLTFATGGELAEMKVLDVRRLERDTAWSTRLYRRGTVRDRCREMTVDLGETKARAVRVQLGADVAEREPRRLTLVFRAYDEGVAFRYVIPEQPAFGGFELLGERSEWRFPGKCGGWFTSYRSDANGNEEPFLRRQVADIGPEEFVGMPATIDVAGQQVALCEAALVNWAGLYYRTPKAGQPDGASVFEAYLTPLPKSHAATAGSAVIRTTPAASPWRVMICADTQLDLLKKNDIIVNLNPPPEEGLDFSWVKPGASSWDWWAESNNSLSTDVTLKLVDFAAEMGWPYHTVDGGWYGFARRPNHGPDVKLEPRPGFDLKRIVGHASAKGVGIWVWIHWEEINDVGIDETFARLEKWGVKGVKTDFLNRQDQWIVNWYERVCRAAARHRVMVNFHGAFKPTGTERTWPNNLTREGVLGNEMNIFSTRITPTHCATLPFTRFLLGPGDFTPGSFANVYSKDFVPQVKKGHRYGDETDRCPHWAEEMGTRAHAVAQCVAFDGGLTTLCDWPERYRGADGIEALRTLPTVWKATTPLAGACGEHYAVLRETHDGRFYFAAFTVKRRNVDLDLGFLGDGQWKMTVFADDPELTPTDAKALAVGTRTVGRREKISFGLCDEGGAVAVFERAAKTP